MGPASAGPFRFRRKDHAEPLQEPVAGFRAFRTKRSWKRGCTHEQPWTAEEDAQLLVLREAGLKWQVIAKRLRRTESSVISRAVILRAEQTLRPDPSKLNDAR